MEDKLLNEIINKKINEYDYEEDLRKALFIVSKVIMNFLNENEKDIYLEMLNTTKIYLLEADSTRKDLNIILNNERKIKNSFYKFVDEYDYGYDKNDYLEKGLFITEPVNDNSGKIIDKINIIVLKKMEESASFANINNTFIDYRRINT